MLQFFPTFNARLEIFCYMFVGGFGELVLRQLFVLLGQKCFVKKFAKIVKIFKTNL